MKKQTIAILTTLLVTSCAFALPAFNADNNKEVSNKITSVLQQKAEAQKQETFVEIYRQALAKGSFSEDDIVTPSFQTESFRAETDIRITDDKYGDIMLTVFAPKGTKAALSIEQHYVNAISNDPHALVELIVHITINGKETKFVAAHMQAIDLAYIVDYDAPSQNLPLEGATGKCPRCGAEDPYHCGKGHIGPCSQDKPAAKPTQEVIWEKRHSAECNDEYHCHCPSAVSEITGIAVVGSTTTATKTFDGGTFTASIFPTKDGNLAYSVKPVKDADLSVSVVTDPKTNADPHQYLDINLVVKEKDAKGNVKKTTQIFIMSADATTL